MILNAIVAGEEHTGFPLVILHGLMGSADNWRSAVKAWGRERHVIALDLRNHGRSPHTSAMNYADMAADVVETLATLDVRQFDLLGHSMGGKTAIALACAYPALIHRLVIEDIAPVNYRHEHRDIFEAMQAVAGARIKERREADMIMQPFLTDLGTRQFIATNLVRDEEGLLRWRVALENIIQEYPKISDTPLNGSHGEQIAGRFEQPTLLVMGEHSSYVTPEGIKAARQIFPELTIERLPTGHWVHAEKFTAFKSIVDNFLNR
ncbi:Esterase YbfF [Halomonadaceae bacterium LMG 33818]|uniref:alpha/beta fold hydrolase n=1 Tax=Cernens ardua TaxID=3402176 RepID=UPI003EDB9FF7